MAGPAPASVLSGIAMLYRGSVGSQKDGWANWSRSSTDSLVKRTD